MSSQPNHSADGAAASDVEPDISYEQARAELREIVSKLEGGGQPLEESLALWQRGEQLATACQRWLDGARSELDAAIAASDQAADKTDRGKADTD